MIVSNSCKKPMVLVVDDQPKTLRFVEIDLKIRGFEVVTTTSGQQALEIIKSETPDVIILDILMPEMDGFEVLRRLRAFSRLPVIAFSASHEARDDCLRLGANDFIHKPFRPDDLFERLGSLLQMT